jgi:hypothetical protein
MYNLFEDSRNFTKMSVSTSNLEPMVVTGPEPPSKLDMMRGRSWIFCPIELRSLDGGSRVIAIRLSAAECYSISRLCLLKI